MKIGDSKPRWGLVWLILAVLGLFAVLPFLLFHPKPPELPRYKIQNFTGPVQIFWSETKKWGPARRGASLGPREKIRTGAEGEVDLFVPGEINLRIKQNSEMEMKNPRMLEGFPSYHLHLVKGAVLGTTHKKKQNEAWHQITTPTLESVVQTPGTTFQIEMNSKNKETAVRVLEGEVRAQAPKAKKALIVKELERTSAKTGASPTKPIRVSRKEWDKLKEGYDLFERNPVKETKQIDLSKQAGNGFDYVFDHGTFYTPNFGFSDREFILDETTQKVYFRVDYDVFPPGSFVGMYMKTRELDLAQIKAFEFDIRTQAGQGFPDSVRIEFKSDFGIVRAFIPRDFRETWRTYSYPVNVRQSSPIKEMTIVFANDRAKAHKKGSLYFRNFKLIPQDKPMFLEKPEMPAAAPPLPSFTNAAAPLPPPAKPAHPLPGGEGSQNQKGSDPGV